jgi:hypothetical protein
VTEEFRRKMRRMRSARSNGSQGRSRKCQSEKRKKISG